MSPLTSVLTDVLYIYFNVQGDTRSLLSVPVKRASTTFY